MNAKLEFNRQESELIDRWRRTLTQEVRLPILLGQDLRGERLRLFGERFAFKAPEVKIQFDLEEEGFLPALVPRTSVRLHGVPLGRELAPFLELLTIADQGPGDVSDPIRSRVDQVALPAALKLYIMPQCPYCPQMVRMLGRLACLCEPLDLAIIDGALFQDEAQKEGIRSAPTLILEGQYRWSGLTDLNEILDAVVNRDSFHLGISSLKKMLTQGRAQELAEMMLAEKKLFPAFIDLLTDAKWPVRLGALVAMEYIAESNRSLSQKVIAPITDRFQQLSDTIKGDALYLFGLVGGRGVIPFLNDILPDEQDPSVKEAALEAIDAIRSRHD